MVSRPPMCSVLPSLQSHSPPSDCTDFNLLKTYSFHNQADEDYYNHPGENPRHFHEESPLVYEPAEASFAA